MTRVALGRKCVLGEGEKGGWGEVAAPSPLLPFSPSPNAEASSARRQASAMAWRPVAAPDRRPRRVRAGSGARGSWARGSRARGLGFSASSPYIEELVCVDEGPAEAAEAGALDEGLGFGLLRPG